jgi:hypothetical protein
MIRDSLIRRTTIQSLATVRGWLRRMRGKTVSTNHNSQKSIADIQNEYPGSWVAFKGGDVVAAAHTPYQLVADLHSRRIENSTIVRIPDPQEPELVGWG